MHCSKIIVIRAPVFMNLRKLNRDLSAAKNYSDSFLEHDVSFGTFEITEKPVNLVFC